MLKKISLVLLLLVAACGKQTEESYIDERYVDPVKDVFLFGELDANTKVDIKKANGNKDYSNYQFKMLGKDCYKDNIIDINGNTINLNNYDNVVFEIVSIECNHCRELISNHLDEMLSYDVTLVQYFNIGKAESIIKFYDELGINIPDNLIIIPTNANIHDYIKDYLSVETYPTLVSFVNGKVSFVATGEFDDISMEYFYDISFNNQLTNLVDKNGNDLLSLLREPEDVKAQLSIENQEKIASIDNNQSTIDATYKVIGSSCDFDKISNHKSEIYMNEITDFSIYKDKELVLLYTYLRGDEKDDERVDFINSLIDSNKKYEYIVVLVEGLESSSTIYKGMLKKYKCPTISVLGYMPDDFYKIGINAYPTAFFIRKGTFTGAYSNVKDIDMFNIALDIFLSDDCVALLRNN